MQRITNAEQQGANEKSRNFLFTFFLVFFFRFLFTMRNADDDHWLAELCKRRAKILKMNELN